MSAHRDDVQARDTDRYDKGLLSARECVGSASKARRAKLGAGRHDLRSAGWHPNTQQCGCSCQHGNSLTGTQRRAFNSHHHTDTNRGIVEQHCSSQTRVTGGPERSSTTVIHQDPPPRLRRRWAGRGSAQHPRGAGAVGLHAARVWSDSGPLLGDPSSDHVDRSVAVGRTDVDPDAVKLEPCSGGVCGESRVEVHSAEHVRDSPAVRRVADVLAEALWLPPSAGWPAEFQEGCRVPPAVSRSRICCDDVRTHLLASKRPAVAGVSGGFIKQLRRSCWRRRRRRSLGARSESQPSDQCN